MLHSCNMYLTDQIHLPFDTDVCTHETSPSLPRQMPSQLLACISLYSGLTTDNFQTNYATLYKMNKLHCLQQHHFLDVTTDMALDNQRSAAIALRPSRRRDIAFFLLFMFALLSCLPCVSAPPCRSKTALSCQSQLLVNRLSQQMDASID